MGVGGSVTVTAPQLAPAANQVAAASSGSMATGVGKRVLIGQSESEAANFVLWDALLPRQRAAVMGNQSHRSFKSILAHTTSLINPDDLDGPFLSVW